MSFKSKVLNLIIALAVAVTFIPVTGQFAFAEGGTPGFVGEPVTAAPAKVLAQTLAFHAKGKVKGLKLKSRTYKSVQVCWTGFAGAKGYELYRANKKSGKYKRIKTLSTCQYNDKGNKTLGKKKFYKVRAYTVLNGKKVYSKFSSIFAAAPKLSTPKDIKTTGAAGAVTVKWDGVSGAKKYQVYRATSKSGKYKKITTTKSKSFKDGAPSDGKRYYYKVRACRKVGKKEKYGNFSAPMEGMALLGNVANLSVTVSPTGTVTATWSKKTGAEGYELQRAVSEGSFVTVGTTTESKMEEILTESGQYTYRVRAFATVNGQTQYGAYSAGGRGDALAQARSWVGCKESNGSYKKIIDVFNKYGPSCGKIGYSTPWCAAFVSAVAINTGNTSVIPVHSYCPTMLSKFAKKTYDKKYTPQGADVIFFDWNWNKVPDHVGMVEKTDGSNVTTIEGNYRDAVKRRTFKKGYSLVLAYGLPNYSISNAVSYTAPEKQETADPDVVTAACGGIEEALQACEEDFAYDASAAADTEPAEEAAILSEAAAPTETETAEKIIEYIQEEAPAAEAVASNESEYNAFLVYEICDEMDIDACVVTVTEPDGSESSYNEVVLDGELYILDAGQDGGALEKYTPEEIN